MPPKTSHKTTLLIDSRLHAAGMPLRELTDNELGKIVRNAMQSILTGTASTFGNDDILTSGIDVCMMEKRFGWSLVVEMPP